MTRSRWFPAGGLFVAAWVAAACASGRPGPAAQTQLPPDPPAGDQPAPSADQAASDQASADQAQESDQASAAEPASEGPVAPAVGIYSAAQAARGEIAFDEVCAQCHTTSEFRGRTFQGNWGRRTVYSFFRTVRSTMPDDNPGGLDEQTYLDVVSYVMRMNGHDAGPAEMLPDSPMRQVRMDPSGSSG